MPQAFAGEQSAPEPTPSHPPAISRHLKGWGWRLTGGDWELVTVRELGSTLALEAPEPIARIRQEDDGWRVVYPRIVAPRPPIEPLEPAKARAETVAMWALPSRMPTQPKTPLAIGNTTRVHDCYSLSGQAWVKSALASREDALPTIAAPGLQPSTLDVPDFLRREREVQS